MLIPGDGRATWGQRTEEEPDKSKAADQGVAGLCQGMAFQVITFQTYTGGLSLRFPIGGFAKGNPWKET